jgi:iron complex outermembrane receptor protein
MEWVPPADLLTSEIFVSGAEIKMIPHRFKLARSTVYMLSLFSSAGVFAAEAAVPAEQEAAVLEGITVTAQKREENVQDVPAAVTAIGGTAIRDNELRTTKDLAREIPGATGWNAESRARPRFFLRGIGSNEATNNAVQPIGIYNDEVYLLNSLFLGGPLFDLDRVEVLRGPQGTLWGKNTTGGAYNFVSKRPTFTTDGYAKIGIGDHGQRLVEGAYGGPIQDDVLAQRFSFHYEERDGWATNRLNGADVGDLQDIALRYQLLAKITPDLRASVKFHVRRFDGTDTPTYPVTRPGIPTFGYTAPYVTAGDRGLVDLNGGDPRTKINHSGVTANVNWDIGRLSLTSITAFDSGRREAEPSDGDASPVEVSRSYGKNSSHQFSQEFRLASPRTDALNWIVGAYYFKDKNDSYGATATTLPVNAANPALAYTQYQQKTDSKAVFGSVTYNVTDRFALTGGLRYTSEKVGIDLNSLGSSGANGTVPFGSNNWWFVNQAGRPLQTVATQNDSNTWDNVGFDFTPQYWLADNQLAFFRIASGYRSGNYAGSSRSAPPAVVQPEKLTAYEVGYKSAWLNNRVTFNANAYYYDYKDMQLTVNRVIGGQFVSVLANAGQGEIKGIEFEARALLTQGLTLRGNFSSLHTKFKEFTTGNVSYAGYNFARVPDITGLIGLDYRVPVGTGTLQLATDWSYNSKTNFNVTDNTDPFALQKGFWLGTLRASYVFAGGKTVLGVFVNNVTDKNYKIQAMLYNSSRYNTRLGDPRTVGVTLTTRF